MILTFLATRFMKKSSCSETGSTRGASVVMLAFSACPAMAMRSLDRYTPAQTSPDMALQFMEGGLNELVSSLGGAFRLCHRTDQSSLNNVWMDTGQAPVRLM